MARKKFIRKPSKYEDEKIHVLTTVIKIEEQNVLINEKYKTVFYAKPVPGWRTDEVRQEALRYSKSKTKPEGVMCIAWGHTVIVEGSEVKLTGRFKNDCFLVWSMFITNSKRTKHEQLPNIEEIKKKLKELKQNERKL